MSRRVIAGVRALAGGVEDAGAWKTDRLGDAVSPERHMGPADTQREARPRARQVHGQPRTQMHTTIETEPHDCHSTHAAAEVGGRVLARTRRPEGACPSRLPHRFRRGRVAYFVGSPIAGTVGSRPPSANYGRRFSPPIGKSFGRRGTDCPAAFFAQYPRGGFGTFNCLHTLAKATSDMPYWAATFWVGSAQTSL